ncbi:MAG: beta-ketoacyl synthase N-terminal-like domain-containing protein [Candidatus Omnitrophota bacterium]
MHKIAITGMGVVSPSGIGKRQFWANIKSGRSFIKKITRFDAVKYPSHIAGQIDDLEKYSHISERLLKKIDAFSHMALIAAELALQDAGIDIKNEDPNLVGIFLGMLLAGGFTRRQSYGIYIWRAGRGFLHIWPAPGFQRRLKGRFPFIMVSRGFLKQ